jgi:hypothetical protein
MKSPNDWGMFTTKGNNSLRRKAERLIMDMESANGQISKEVKVFAKFFRSWRKMSNTKTMGEASDTAVREMVWDFALQVARNHGIDSATLDNVWDSKEAR